MIRIEVAPEIEQRFADAARARGLEADAYASQLIASAVSLTAEKHLSQSDAEEFLARMASLGAGLPELPAEAYDRANLYQDHD